MWAPVSWTICSNSTVCLYIKLLHFEEFLGHLEGGGSSLLFSGSN